MAIQNDNTLVTKGDLKALYSDKIAPYLGANLAIRTNVSDYYSEDEKVVGIWTDGKPLYQKTIHVASATIPAWTRYTISTTSLLDNDNIFVVGLFGGYYADFDGSAKQYHFWGGQDITGNSVNSMYGYNAHYRQRDKVIALNGSWGGLQYTITDLTFHFQYTKTTDTASTALTAGCYDINFPNTWPENTEIYFGNGLYGQRRTGMVNATTELQEIKLNTVTTINKLWSCGGTINRSAIVADASDVIVGSDTSALNFYSYLSLEHNKLCLYIKENSSKINLPYDVWVTYTK